MGGAPLDCDDLNVCTADSCDPGLGCVHDPVPDGTSCSDGDVCNGDEVCQAGLCEPGTPLGCVACGETVMGDIKPPDEVGTYTFLAGQGDVVSITVAELPDGGPYELTLAAYLDALDSDCDGIVDLTDNCSIIPNAAQQDTDADGIGDFCECGDASLDGRVNTTDARLIQRCAVGAIPCLGLCDVTGEGLCNTTDAPLIQRFAVAQLTKDDLRCAERP